MEHNRTKKAALLLLAALLTLGSCSQKSETPPSAPVSETAETAAPVEVRSGSVLKNLDGYSLIRSDLGGADTVTAIRILHEAMDDYAKDLKTDWVNQKKGEVIPSGEKEILVGRTNRAVSEDAYQALISARKNHQLDFSITFCDAEIVIMAADDAVLPEAVTYFVDNILDRDIKEFPAGTVISVLHEFPMTDFLGIAPDGLSIVCTEEAQNSAARMLSSYLLVNTGFAPEITAEGSGIILKRDSTMDPQDYEIVFGDNGITVRAGCNIALNRAALLLLDGTVKAGENINGHIDSDIPMTVSAPRDGAVLELVWNDEFDGDTLNPENWTLNAKMNQGDIENGNDEHNVMVRDGNLILRSWQEGEGKYSTNTSVTTDGTMSFRYGYLEMYACVPYIPGAWPSFWMQSKDTHRTVDYMTEIDIFEVFGSRNSLASQLHKWYDTGHDQLPDKYNTNYFFKNHKELNSEYHLYGFGWTPEEMYFTVDGEIYFSYDLSVDFGGVPGMEGFHDPLFVIFNNFLFTDASEWQPTRLSSKTEYPISYYIDWIRLYQKPGEGEIFYDGVR